MCGRSQSDKCSSGCVTKKAPKWEPDWRLLASRHLSVPHLWVRRRAKDALRHPVVSQTQKLFANLQIVRQSGKPDAFARIGQAFTTGIGHGALLGWSHRRERKRLSATGGSFIRRSNEAGDRGESSLLFLEVGESCDKVFTLPEFTVLALHKLLRFLDGLFLVRTFDASYC